MTHARWLGIVVPVVSLMLLGIATRAAPPKASAGGDDASAVKKDETKLTIVVRPDKPTRYVSQTATWDVEVTNPGEKAVDNVVLKVRLPKELEFREASDDGKENDASIVWKLGSLGAGKSASRTFTAKTRKKAQAARVVAFAEAGAVTGKAEATVEILGLPALRIEVVDVDDPIEVGAETTYKIDLSNQGSEDLNQLRTKRPSRPK